MATRSVTARRGPRPQDWGRYPLSDHGQHPLRTVGLFWMEGGIYPNLVMPNEPADPPGYFTPHVERPVRVNEAEYGTPRFSSVGVGFKMAAGNALVREQPAVLTPARFTNLVGVFGARAANTLPVVARERYQGQLPMRVQPKINKPWPWRDKTRGLP